MAVSLDLKNYDPLTSSMTPPINSVGVQRRYVLLFAGLFLLTQWPFAHWASMVKLPFGGVPFLALYLTLVYAALIGLLIAAARRNL